MSQKEKTLESDVETATQHQKQQRCVRMEADDSNLLAPTDVGMWGERPMATLPLEAKRFVKAETADGDLILIDRDELAKVLLVQTFRVPKILLENPGANPSRNDYYAMTRLMMV